MAFWNRKKNADDGEFITIKVRKRDILPPHYVELYEKLLEMQRAAPTLPQAEKPTEKPRRSDEEDALAVLGRGDNPLPLSSGIPRAVRKIPAGMVRIYTYADTRYISIPASLGRRLNREGWKCWCPIFNAQEYKFFIAFSKELSQIGRRIEHNGSASLRLRCTEADVQRIEKCLNVHFTQRGNNLVSHTPPKIDERGLLRIYLYK